MKTEVWRNKSHEWHVIACKKWWTNLKAWFTTKSCLFGFSSPSYRDSTSSKSSHSPNPHLGRSSWGPETQKLSYPWPILTWIFGQVSRNIWLWVLNLAKFKRQLFQSWQCGIDALRTPIFWACQTSPPIVRCFLRLAQISRWGLGHLFCKAEVTHRAIFFQSAASTHVLTSIKPARFPHKHSHVPWVGVSLVCDFDSFCPSSSSSSPN